MADEWAKFQAEMQARAAMQEETPRVRSQTDDETLMVTMSKIELKRGQMLLLGPKSVAILSTPGAGKTQLTDAYIINKSEWNPCRS